MIYQRGPSNLYETDIMSATYYYAFCWRWRWRERLCFLFFTTIRRGRHQVTKFKWQSSRHQSGYHSEWNQTWLAGNSPLNEGFSGKIIYKWLIVHCQLSIAMFDCWRVILAPNRSSWLLEWGWSKKSTFCCAEAIICWMTVKPPTMKLCCSMLVMAQIQWTRMETQKLAWNWHEIGSTGWIAW